MISQVSTMKVIPRPLHATTLLARNAQLKNLKRLLITLLFVAGPLAPAQAKSIMVLGQSEETCSTWLFDRAGNQAQATVDEEYICGFLTGMENMYSLAHNKSVSFTIWPQANIFGWVDHFCDTHPNTALDAAGAAFWFHSGAVSVTP